MNKEENPLSTRTGLIGMYLAAALWVAAPTQAAHYEVVLLGGQSNMDGRASASGLPPNLQQPQADVLFYEGGSLRTLRPDSGTDFGPEITFGRTVADARPSTNLALIKYAAGGTNLETQWAPTSGSAYTQFKSTVSAGLSALSNGGEHTYEITGMLWTQGESDVGRTTAQYQADLNSFIADIRTNYGADLPFFISRLPNLSSTSVRTAQENVAAADAHAYLIDTDGFDMRDALHFSAQGQIDLGEAFAASYLNAVPEPGSLMLLGGGVIGLLVRRRRN